MNRIVGFLKARNELVKGNLYRVLANLEMLGLDGGIVCDDASVDGTTEVLETWVRSHGWLFMRVKPEDQDFTKELHVKQAMMAEIHKMDPRPDWIYWTDADETWDAAGTTNLRSWLDRVPAHVTGIRAHYTQLWRSASWARTDDGFDDGSFVKLWRYSPGLTFDLRPGTHRQQFPTAIEYAKAITCPFEIIHWGNASSVALRWKAYQYAGGLGGVDRHIAFGHTPQESLATGMGYDLATWSRPNPTYRSVVRITLPPKASLETRMYSEEPPKPFTLDEIKRIRSMGSMHRLPGWFTVCIPTYNRANTLPKALESLLAQRYENWIGLVVDDGSTDETPELMAEWVEKDPRILYIRCAENKGGVRANEIGMSCACDWTEYWSRLGSDDFFGPEKLGEDAEALKHHDAIFGPFTVIKHGKPDHVCAGSWGSSPMTASERLKRGEFLASWANVAVKTSVLRGVREKWGNFCDPALHSMEDFCTNARIAYCTEWAWRPGRTDSAHWNCLEGVGAAADASASANAARTARDHAITMNIIRQMREQASERGDS
jgi:hypothetical protein